MKRKNIYPYLLFSFFSLLIVAGCHMRERSNCTGWSGGNGGSLRWRAVDNYSGNSRNYNGSELPSDIQLKDKEKLEDLDPGEVVYQELHPLTQVDYPHEAAEYERYASFTENDWINASTESKSTFSIDVDNASYTNFRRFVNNGQLPPKDAVRMEEWLNFFNYELEAPESSDQDPLKITSEIGACPWNEADELLMIKLQAKLPPEPENLPPSNLVFLVDVSGSMNAENKLPLVQESMITLVNQLRAEDKISIVTYAGASEVMLEPTAGDQKDSIIAVINRLRSGGGTAGSEGIETAYKLAEENYNPNGNNRIIVASDGDWNIGVTDGDKLVSIIEKKRETGIFLSVLGFGMYNLNDQMMEKLADNGNGNYAYIDSQKEADRLFRSEFAGSIHVIAKDVKLQVDFDSTQVESYRLLGYENRVLENWQFEADSIDAGDLGMGQNVIAFYQIKRKEGSNGAIGKVDFRYKNPTGDVSKLLSHNFSSTAEVSSDFEYASCVVEFALCLVESEYRKDASMNAAIQRGRRNLGNEQNSLSYEKRVEFVGLMEETAKMWTGYVVEEAPEETYDNAPKLNLYPNPATDYFTIEVPGDLSEEWSIQIFSNSGKLMLVDHFRETKSGRVDINGLTSGTYIVKVYGQGYNYGYLRLVVN